MFIIDMATWLQYDDLDYAYIWIYQDYEIDIKPRHLLIDDMLACWVESEL